MIRDYLRRWLGITENELLIQLEIAKLDISVTKLQMENLTKPYTAPPVQQPQQPQQTVH